MKRERIDYVPIWGGAFERYARSWVRSQGWRLEKRIGGYDDQMQECALIFTKLANRYHPENERHLMGLFKRALMNHWADQSPKDWVMRNEDNLYEATLVEKQRKRRAEDYADQRALFYDERRYNGALPEFLDGDELSTFAIYQNGRRTEGSEYRSNLDGCDEMVEPDAELACDLGNASHELVEVVRLILNAPAELVSFLWGDDDNVAVQERRLCRMAGVACRPVLSELRALITGK